MYDKEYHKKYREEHKEEKAACDKKYREEHKDEIAVRTKKWQEAHKEEIIAYREEHKEEKAISMKDWRGKLKKEVHRKLKGRCVLCGGVKNLCVHERKGNKHPTGHWLLVLKFPSKFALLCKRCHQSRMHWAMEKYGFSFEQVLQYKDLLFGKRKGRESTRGKSLVEVRDEKKLMHPKGRSIKYSGMEERAQRAIDE